MSHPSKIHPSKRESILHWFNALTTDVDVGSLSQFADGKLFADIVSSIYSQPEIKPVPFTLADCSVKEENVATIDIVDKNAPAVANEENDNDERPSTSAEEMDIVQKKEEPSYSETDIEENASDEESNLNEIQKKYNYIEKFIDTFFRLKSSDLVDYHECVQGKEMELSKVAVLLLSAMVQNFLSSDNTLLQTITHLSHYIQEEIKECLSLVLERDEVNEPLRKTDLHRLLGGASKQKATPRRQTPRERTSAARSAKKLKGDKVSSIIKEDIINSPLHGFIYSPNSSQHRAAITMFRKETQLSKLRNDLHEEEMKVVDLIAEKNHVLNELSKKREECDSLKLEIREQREEASNQVGQLAVERANCQTEMERLKKTISELEEELKYIKDENTNICLKVESLEEKLETKNLQKESVDQSGFVNLINELEEMREKLNNTELVAHDYKRKMEALDQDLISYKQMYEEVRRHSPVVTPAAASELVSDIYVTDSKEEQIKEMEQELAKLNKLNLDLNKLVQEKNEELEDTQSKLDKLASLQEQFDNLANKSKSCASCGAESQQDETATSESSGSQVAVLWTKNPRVERTTRSKSTTGSTSSTEDCPSVAVNTTTVDKLKAQFRTLAKMVIRWKIITDTDSKNLLQQIESQIRSQTVKVEDIVNSFERLLCVVKKFNPNETVSSSSDDKVLEVEIDQDLKNKLCQAQRRFNKLVHQKKVLDEELMNHKFDIQNLKIEKDSAREISDKEIKELKSKVAHLEKKYSQACIINAKESQNNQTLKVLLEDLKKAQAKIKVEPCSDCPRLRQKMVTAKDEVKAAQKREQQFLVLKRIQEDKIKSINDKNDNLINENKELQHKMLQLKASMVGNTVERNILINKYMEEGKEEERRKAVEKEKKRKAEELEDKQPVISFHTYIVNPERRNPANDTSVSSQFGNRTINSAYLQTEDEEDFLNHSSLAQIQNSTYQSPPENRLSELQRRNTFCPPHLQSSYPLELHKMTPSERKYSMAPPSRYESRPSILGCEARPSTSRYEARPSTSWFEAGPSTSGPVGQVTKRLKVSGTETAGARVHIGTSRNSLKPRTPTRQSFLGTNRVFKTPKSIQRLMKMQGKKN